MSLYGISECVNHLGRISLKDIHTRKKGAIITGGAMKELITEAVVIVVYAVLVMLCTFTLCDLP